MYEVVCGRGRPPHATSCSESDKHAWRRDIEGPISRVDPHPLRDEIISIGPRLPGHAGIISKERMGEVGTWCSATLSGTSCPKCDADGGHSRPEHERQLTLSSEGMGLIVARSESTALDDWCNPPMERGRCTVCSHPGFELRPQPNPNMGPPKCLIGEEWGLESWLLHNSHMVHSASPPAESAHPAMWTTDNDKRRIARKKLLEIGLSLDENLWTSRPAPNLYCPSTSRETCSGSETKW